MALLLAGKDDPYRNLCPYLHGHGDQDDLALPAASHLHNVFSKPESATTISYIDRWLYSSQRARQMAVAHCQESMDNTGQRESNTTSSIKNGINGAHHAVDNGEKAESEARIDSKSFIQMLFSTSAWKLGKVIQSHHGRYGFLPPPSPLPSTPIDDTPGSVKEIGSKIRSMVLLASELDDQPSVEAIADRLANDLGTSEALFSTFGTHGCAPGVVPDSLPFYSVDETVNHFRKLRDVLKGSELIFLSLYEDSTVAYYHESDIPTKPPSPAPLVASKAAHVVNVCLGAFVSFLPDFFSSEESSSCEEFKYVRKIGSSLPRSRPQSDEEAIVAELVWFVQQPRHLILMRRILRIIASRTYQRNRIQGNGSSTASTEFVEAIMSFLESSSAPEGGDSRSPVEVLLLLAQGVFMDSWNAEAEFSWSSDVGCSIEFMRILHDHKERLGLSLSRFQIHEIQKCLDAMELPLDWMKYEKKPNHNHLLSFPWLTDSSTLFTYFRVINRSRMIDAVHASVTLRQLPHRLFKLDVLLNGHERQIADRLEISMRDFLTLNIRREHILEDALNELFRRQKREMRRPLKIRMGMQEGEEGVDLGGIQQEFFRLALGEALDPSYGIFTVDGTTKMTWFYPGAVTPKHQIFLIGLLVGLAVYNGITLSVTFPLALYRKLLGLPVDKLQHIEDGWPDLARGLKALLDHPENDVEDVFMRSYVFSEESNGVKWSVDMSSPFLGDEWPAGDGEGLYSVAAANSAAENADMVTNKNRGKYVSDYIYWLTDRSIRRQWNCFSQGFSASVNRKSLSLFTPAALKDLVEGFQEIDVLELQKVTTYEGGYAEDDRLIQDFWNIVRAFSPTETRKLLEFVTASDRVPVKGVRDIAFSIVKNGVGDEVSFHLAE